MTTTATAAAMPVPPSDEPPPTEGSPPPAPRIGHSARQRGGLAALLVGTAALYMWNLGASGYANDFYAAAVQAGTKNWKAFLFGSFDSSNFITVDKPPASLWPMELSGRIFGFSSWSMLLPQAVEGVLAVWLLYATVRRWFGPSAGLIAGTLLAITPVAVLMFRFNNPDALMTLLIVAAAYCVTRAIDAASTRWLLLAGLVMGFSFLAKGFQPFTVLPALALGYLVAAPTGLRRRLLQLLASGVAVLVGAGWWVLAVTLTPAASRPYIGGSGNNTALGLAFGYNGLGRITGNESTTGSGGRVGGGANFSGSTGLGRLFNSEMGGQISWLLPAALIAVVALAVLTRRRPRTDRMRAAAIIWGGWLLVTAGVLSYASGIIHNYYTVELAPALAALVAVATVTLWRRRHELPARWALAAGVLATGVWSYALLRRSPSWYPWVSYVVLIGALGCAAVLAVPAGRIRRGVLAAGLTAAVAVGGGSAAFAVDTAATVHTGATPSAGPATTGGGFGGPGGGRAGGGLRGGFGATPPQGGSGTPPAGGFGGPAGGGGGGGAPGGSGTTTVSSALTALLKATTTRWSAAAIGSQSAAPLELASGTAVMSIGGFNGGDNAPTLAQFQAYVANGEIRYFIAGGGAGGGGGGSSGSAISTWVAAHYSSTTVGGTTVYDLTKATS
ncbi:MAG: putative glycosyltransferase [Pseudonocardiales bacterium]|nr:putative glycosyltransferase [Pseudonocardiales bacterium]